MDKEYRSSKDKHREDKKKSNQTSSNVFGKDADPKLEWMYKKPHEMLNREEYLLGRAVDKNFERAEAEAKSEKLEKMLGITTPKNHVEHECVPFSIRAYKNFESSEQVDLQRKLLEDPLVAIKTKEMESRRKILENPVKLKQLHKLLKIDISSKDRERKKSGKKKKKKNKNSDSSDSDDDLDKLLAKKLKKVKKTLGRDSDSSELELKMFIDGKYEILKDLGKKSKQKKDKRSRDVSTSSNSSTSDSNLTKYRNQRQKLDNESIRRRDESTRRYQQRSGDNQNSRNNFDSRRNYRNDRSRDNHYGNNRNRKTKYEENNRRNREDYKTKDRPTKYEKSRSKSPKDSLTVEKSRANVKEKKGLTEDEKRERLRKMMDDANWREQERSQKVRKYRDEYEREEKTSVNYDRNFMNKEMHKAISQQNSVESRIKSNINNIQRNAFSMDSNFARR